MKRRQFIQAASAAGVLGLAGCASTSDKGPHVVVVGGGYGGATAAKYLRMWSDYGIRVTLVEPNASFVSCPISNLVIGAARPSPMSPAPTRTSSVATACASCAIS